MAYISALSHLETVQMINLLKYKMQAFKKGNTIPR